LIVATDLSQASIAIAAFCVSLAMALELGAFAYARGVADNYLTHYVRSDGTLRYRGPELALDGRMLTLFGQYYFFTDDSDLLLRHRAKILGLAATLRTLRSRALRLPKDDATYGMPRGNDEADTYIGTIVCGTTYGNRTEAEHCKTEQPYISISSEMVRGFRELGAAFTAIGKAQGRSDVASEGAQLSREAEELHGDFITSLRRSTLAPNASWGNTLCHPHIAGWPSCEWDIGLPPIEGTGGAGLGAGVGRAQIRPNQKTFAMEGRTYSEALYSGVLPPDYVKDIVVFVAGYIGVMGYVYQAKALLCPVFAG